QASAMVLSPCDDHETALLLEAFGRPELQPRPQSAGDGSETRRPGVFFCDPALDPQICGAAAATRLADWLVRVTSHPSKTAIVDPTRCRACSTCVKVCEVGAPGLIVGDQRRIRSWIDPIICTGCGTCAARCPSGAISAGTVSNEQLEAMLGVILAGGG
ncbi:MAG: 4Fe-4S binding protein, partial [Chloroflexota bacterium]